MPSPASIPAHRRPRGPLIAAGFMAFLVLAYFGWQFLLKYQRDKDGNTTLTVEAKGADDQVAKVASDSARALPAGKLIQRRFDLQHADVGRTAELLYKVFGRSNVILTTKVKAILVDADADTMTTVEELLGALDQPAPQALRSNDALPAREQEAGRLRKIVNGVEHRLNALNRELRALGSDSIATDDAKAQSRKQELSAEIGKQQLSLAEARKSLADAEQAVEHLRARHEAIDTGVDLDALLMDEIRDDPRLIELQHKMADVVELYEHARAVAKHPTDPAVARYAARYKTLKEAEDKLIADLRKAALLNLRRGTDRRSRQTKGIVQGTQTSPGGQTKIFSLRNSLASEAYEMLRKLYPEDSLRMTTHTTSNQLIVEGDAETLAKIEAILLRLDESAAQKDGKSDGPKGGIIVFPLRNAKASEAMKSLQPLLPDGAVRIAVDDRSNSLIVQGDLEQIAEIEATLRRLDESKLGASASGPTKIQRGHVLRISVAGDLPDAPIDGPYTIDLDGYVNLGAEYGKFKVTGLTADQAQAAILDKLRKILREPKIVLSVESGSAPTRRANNSDNRPSDAPVRIQGEPHALRIRAAGTPADAPIDGVYNLDLDGYVNLGAQYGKIKVAGMTADEAQAAVLAELRKLLREPKVTLTVEARDQATGNSHESHDHGGHHSSDAVSDNDVAILNVHIQSGSTAKKEPRTEEMPLHIAHADGIQKEDGRLAVDFEMYSGLPRTIITRRGGEDYQIVVPYFLVVEGPHLGRKEHILPNWPPRDTLRTEDYSGTFVAPRNLRINNGEPLEIYIERGSTPGGSPDRISNIVKLTWRIPGAPTEDIRYPKGLMKPFEAVHWQKDRLAVQVEGRWYDLVSIDDHKIDAILELAKKTSPNDYQKKIEDDLESLLKQLGQKSLDNFKIIGVRRPSGGIQVFEVRRDAAGRTGLTRRNPNVKSSADNQSEKAKE